MKKNLDKENTLYFQKNYPYYSSKRAITKPFQAILGIGGNIGDVRRRFNHLFIYFQKSPFLEIVESSPILKNPPFGYLEQDDFYNALIVVKTCLRPKALLRYILRSEKKFGRKRSFANAPRTLDIDMIFYEDVQINSRELTLPHPYWASRSSVIIPLSYLKVYKKYIKSRDGK